MEFSLLSYSQKRILAASVLSLLSGYVLGVVNIPRGSLTDFLSPSWIGWCLRINGSPVADSCTNVESFLMVIINTSLLIGASIGSVTSIFVETCFGKVKSIISAYLSFGIGSMLCLSREVIIFSIGRAICGLGVGFSCNLVPSYIFELTNKQNQTLFSTLHNVLFCCGILLSYLFSMVTTHITNYISNLRSSVRGTNESNNIIATIIDHDFIGTIVRNNLESPEKMNLEPSIKDISCSILSIRILFIIPILFSLTLSAIWLLKLNVDTPSRYIKLNDIRAAEEATIQIYGVYDTTRIISQLIEENERENTSTIKLLKAISKSPMRNICLFIPIIICTEVLTGYISLIMNSKVILLHLGIIDQAPKYIVLTGCFLVNFTLSGIFFEIYIGSKKLFVLGLILVIFSYIPICSLLLFSTNINSISQSVIISLMSVFASFGLGIVPTTWKLASTYVSRQIYFSIAPYLFALFWIIAVFSIMITELLPVLVFIFINSCCTFFVLISCSIMN